MSYDSLHQYESKTTTKREVDEGLPAFNLPRGAEAGVLSLLLSLVPPGILPWVL